MGGWVVGGGCETRGSGGAGSGTPLVFREGVWHRAFYLG